MLTGKYKTLYESLIKEGIPKERMFHDPLTTLAFGTDASFYRLVPKLVIRAGSTVEVKKILIQANGASIPVTFRAAGTSLSGQSITDSVLVIVSHGFTAFKIDDGGRKIKLEPGIRGGMANRYLSRYGKKIGPDPASIDSAMIGGIVANNASGMCCGTDQNSYKTIADIDILLADGTELDTADSESKKTFAREHPEIIAGIESISRRINNDKTLRERIIRKYKIKNTTGYSLNAFTDYTDWCDILKHLMIGSEGTLGFISNITYNTVEEFKYKGLALIVFPTIKEACGAVQVLKEMPVSAVELLDRAAIKSVENSSGIPAFLKTLPDGACALLVEAVDNDDKALREKITTITDKLQSFKTLRPIVFTMDTAEQAILWKVRKETLPTVAGMRRPGTTAIIEDICFPVPRLADAVMDLRALFEKDGYSDAVIFGHALAGNLHFMFNQDFGTKEEIEKYAKFMDDIASMVVSKYDGSLKAEHGTGRNMAPFVEVEWGEQAYALMKEIKSLLDPKGILNPGVIINDDPEVHLKNLKPCPKTSDTIDKCMECGFCEGVCVTEGLTFSPRQRVASFREIKRLESSGVERETLALMRDKYKYMGTATCATDSLCARTCPVKVDNGKLTKELRHASHSDGGEKRAMFIAKHMNNVVWWMRAGLTGVYYLRCLVGKRLMGFAAKVARAVTFKVIPAWNENFPRGGGRISRYKLPEYKKEERAKERVVYMPSCITRAMGTSKKSKDAIALTALTEKLLRKAGYDVVYPRNLRHLCCGMAFSSKGYVKAGKYLSSKTYDALMEASEGGKLPILCDMSPCLYTMWSNYDGSPLRLYEPAGFAKEYLIPKLKINQTDKSVAVWAVCSAKKLGVDATIVEIAKLCAKSVTVIEGNCCGFAGDKGFFMPEMNAYGLRTIKEQVKGCSEGYATSRTCEIGLSEHSGLDFKNLYYLLDEASVARVEVSGVEPLSSQTA